MAMRDMKISTLLTLGFGMLVLLITFLGGVAQLKVNTMQRLFGEVMEERIPETTTANQIKEGLGGIAIALRNMILISDTEKVQKEAQKIEVLRQRIDGQVQQLHRQIGHDAGKTILARMVAARQVFDALQAEVLELALGGQVFEAKALLVEKLNPAQDAYFAALDTLLLDQANLLTESTNSTLREALSVKWLVSTTVAVALVVGLWVGWWTVRAITRPLHQAVALSQAVAAGDLSQPLDTTRRNELGQLLQALQSMQTGLVQVVTQVRESAESVSTASAEIANGNTDLSNRTEDQASALQQTSSAMAELRDAVERNATSARDASALALQASQIAHQGGQAVASVVGTMQGISASSQHIAAITGVIDGIAFQTNILALNAAVEAARAGEQGRGFAVVASEVRLLASRSAEAAREIKALIQASGSTITQGATYAEQAGTTMGKVVNAIQQVAEVMQNISVANLAQSQGVAQICDAVVQMDQMTQQNAALVEQMAAAASSLQSQAQDLVGTVAVFTLNPATVLALPA